ncbi:MAG: aminomethyltransferase [Vicingaceae bacterium]|nr:MAG: aminomethyltransferase [Vicingaceae bacterium]
MKKTPFNKLHKALGAKMVDFAGFEMPVQYEGIQAEHINVRENAGVFDVSHMGEFLVKGPLAKEFLQYVTSNDIDKLYPGKVQYSCLPNERGGIVDDLLVYQIDKDEYLLVVNAANIEKDWNWLQQLMPEHVEMQNISDEVALLAVQGPKSIEILQPLTNINLSEIKYYSFVRGKFAGVDDVIISATGYTGAGGFELYFRPEYAEKIWNDLFDAGKKKGLKPAGLGARDTLRLEMGFCLYGNDIDDTTSPLEAGLGWITKFNKNFVGKQVLETQKNQGVKRKLVGFVAKDKGIPRHGYLIKNEIGDDIGNVTSGTFSPSLKEPIGMGYVQAGYDKPGTQIYFDQRGKLIEAEVVSLPFLKN